MKQITRIDIQGDVVAVRYTDDQDPKWVDERVLVTNCRRGTQVQRLAHVGYHLFYLLVENPKAVEINDEILLQWIGHLFCERPPEEHDAPKSFDLESGP